MTSGTTTELNLADFLRQHNLQAETVVFEDNSAVDSAYAQGRCDAVTSDKSALAATRSGMENPEDHVILPETISKEPLTPVVPHGDDQWLDLVKTVLYVLINAEEFGVTQANVDQMMQHENIQIRRMLGTEGEFGQSDLGLKPTFAVDVLKAVGNYGEIYDRYLGPDGLSFPLPRQQNELWTNGGLIYAPPAALGCVDIRRSFLLAGRDGGRPHPPAPLLTGVGMVVSMLSTCFASRVRARHAVAPTGRFWRVPPLYLPQSAGHLSIAER